MKWFICRSLVDPKETNTKQMQTLTKTLMYKTDSVVGDVKDDFSLAY